MNKILTLIISVDCEKDLELLDLNIHSLHKANKTGLEKTQLMIMNQRPTDHAIKSIVNKFDIPIFNCNYETYKGIVFWDVFKSLKEMLPMISTKYFTIYHQEFISTPRSLQHITEFLENTKQPLVKGNLLRLTYNETDCRRGISSNKSLSDKLLPKIPNWTEESTEVLKGIPTIRWTYYEKEIPGMFIEDVCYMDVDWIQYVDFLNVECSTFCDIYDHLTYLKQCLSNYGLMPYVPHLDKQTTSLVHLWHPKGYEHFVPELLEHLKNTKEKWIGTNFADFRAIERLIRNNKTRDFHAHKRAFRTRNDSSLAKFRRKTNHLLKNGVINSQYYHDRDIQLGITKQNRRNITSAPRPRR